MWSQNIVSLVRGTIKTMGGAVHPLSVDTHTVATGEMVGIQDEVTATYKHPLSGPHHPQFVVSCLHTYSLHI